MRSNVLPLPVGLFVISMVGLMAGLASAAAPSVDQALQLVPVQKGVDYDRPAGEEAAKCKITSRKVDGHVGWVVEDANGLTLRSFTDTNGDNVVDQWSYYKDGVEVYRDIDSNYNGKADQYRWFHTAGSRWGLDKDEDGTIDAWKAISAEEVTAEVVAALASRDVERFMRLALTPAELKSLGLGEAKSGQLNEKVSRLQAEFSKLAAQQKTVGAGSKWVQFSGSQPGTVPAGTDGSTTDLLVYENVVAIVETEGSHGQVQIGTLVRVGDAWRVIDVPQPAAEGQPELAASGFFFQAASGSHGKPSAAGPTDAAQKLLADLESLDKAAGEAATPQQRAEYHARRADLLEKIADQARSPEDRDMWLRQLADMVSAAVQSGTYPDGAKRLEALFEKLKKGDGRKDLAAYVKFRQLTAEYGLKLQTAGVDFGKVQSEWLKSLQQYVADYPKSPDASEAMLQLAINHEFAGQEDDAKKWYGRIVQESPDSPAGRKAAGAQTRLDLVGKVIAFQGKGATGGVVDVSKYRGSAVLIQFWATWCEPCKADMAVLKELVAKYGRSGFTVIGVSLDNRPQDLTEYLAENRLPWPQIFEEGGLDSRPANALGILTVPTMILVDQSGKVINRNIRVAELEGELKKLIR